MGNNIVRNEARSFGSLKFISRKINEVSIINPIKIIAKTNLSIMPYHLCLQIKKPVSMLLEISMSDSLIINDDDGYTFKYMRMF